MDAMELLLTRASALRLTEPAPDAGQLEQILRGAVRAPDHGRLRPWRFIRITGAGIGRFGDLLAEAMKRRQPDADDAALDKERQKARRAPMILVVAARLQAGGKIPEVEQLLAVGAATQNVMLGIHALGFGAMWKTGGPAYDDFVKRALGLEPEDAIVGFLYVGTTLGGTSPLPRPEPSEFLTDWA